MEETIMNAHGVSYARLHELLTRLRFSMTVESTMQIQAFRHCETETLVLLAHKPPQAAVREADLLSLRRHLCDNGLIEPEAFNAWLAAA
jgi:hypothetical protein